MPTLELIAFDADDTLWHNESYYHLTQEKFSSLLSPYVESEQVYDALYATEMRNLKIFGYGAKGFALSMIETAIELTHGRVGGAEIQEIINAVKRMLTNDIQLLDGVEETLAKLGRHFPLMLITKGDLFDQESKLARSGLANYFDYVEIVSDKTPEVYSGLLQSIEVQSDRFLMIGNSVRSDILPVVELGGHAVHIPYHVTWAHEEDANHDLDDYHKLDNIRQLVHLIEQFDASPAN